MHCALCRWLARADVDHKTFILLCLSKDLLLAMEMEAYVWQ
jgi:hypothetical protein